MSADVSDYVDVVHQAEKLGLRVPTGIAVLPRGFATASDKGDLLHESSTPTIRKLWREAGVAETPVEPEGERLPLIAEKSLEWVGPMIFIGGGLILQDPKSVSLALNVLANYMTDFFKGIAGPKAVRVDLVVEKAGRRSYKHFHYEGRPGALPDLIEFVREVSADE